MADRSSIERLHDEAADYTACHSGPPGFHGTRLEIDSRQLSDGTFYAAVHVFGQLVAQAFAGTADTAHARAYQAFHEWAAHRAEIG